MVLCRIAAWQLGYPTATPGAFPVLAILTLINQTITGVSHATRTMLHEWHFMGHVVIAAHAVLRH